MTAAPRRPSTLARYAQRCAGTAWGRRAGAVRAARRQDGSMSVLVVFFLLASLSFAAISFDIGHFFLARNELQNAADAAAITGASALLPGNPAPSWTAAQAAASSAVSANSSDGVRLGNATVVSGYWNLAGSPTGMQPSTITPGTEDGPAVQVTVSRANGLNGGPLKFFFAPLFGLRNTAVTASAVAVITAPGDVAAGALFPIAMAKCIFDQYWNSQTGSPKIDPSSGQPYTFTIGDGSSTNGCVSGQWTSFQTNRQDVPTVRTLMTSGNPTPLSIGDAIWIQSGVKDTLYKSVPSNYDALVPVVSQATSSSQPIVAFAAFHIDPPPPGNSKTIQGHLVTNMKVPVGNGTPGPFLGAYVPPRLAQ